MSELRNTINKRMDILQTWMEENYHLTRPEVVLEHIETVSKFWSALSEEDREYIQCAIYAIEEKTEWLL